jgi:hypothetical protein
MTREILPSYTSVSSVSAQDGEYEGSFNKNETNVVVETGKAVEDTDSATNKQNRFMKRHARTIMFSSVGAVLFIGLAAVVYFVLPFGFYRNRNVSTPLQTINNIIMASVFDKNSLLNELSPQYRARQWMLLNDTYGSKLFASRHAQNNPEYITKKIVQRFALAVFYYSMNLSTTNWMNTMTSECVRNTNGTSTWDGLNCNSDNELVALWLGKFPRYW